MRFPGFRKDIHADFDAGGGGIFVKILVATPFPLRVQSPRPASPAVGVAQRGIDDAG